MKEKVAVELGYCSVVEHLPGIPEALNSVPRTTPTNEKDENILRSPWLCFMEILNPSSVPEHHSLASHQRLQYECAACDQGS